MKTTIEKLTEDQPPPRAAVGDWKGGYTELGSISAFVIRKDWKLLDDKFMLVKDIILSLYLYEDGSDEMMLIVGYFGEDKSDVRLYGHDIRFVQVSFLRVYKTGSEYKSFGYKYPVLEVSGVTTDKLFSGFGIAKKIYMTLVDDLKYTIMCDELQYFGARRIWTSLSRSESISVDVVDIDGTKIIKSNVEDLKQGYEDGDFDVNYWSRHYDKSDIRFILREI